MLKRREFILGAAAGLVFATVATAGGLIQWPAATAAQPAAVAQGATLAAAGAVFSPPPGAPQSFADIIEQVSPAVVQIDVRTRVQRPAVRGLQIPGFPFSLPQQPRGEGESEGEGQDGDTMEGAGAGSGFFISADGHIVTNHHVIANASRITVRLSDDRELTAEVVGTDEATDLAVLKVDGGPFPFVRFETGAQPRVGDWVIALGNPFGLGGSATAGIVSARSRNIGEQYVDFIQIDAPINRGNSGGPTFDIYGRVIGVNTAIFSPTGGSVGIGFAIPADVSQRVTQQIIENGSVERGWLGVTIGNLTSEYREALGLDDDVQGAYIVDVTPGGPAEGAGLQAGDIVTELNGEGVRNNTDLTRRVGQARAGETLRLTVIREERRMTINVRAGRRPPESELRADPSSEGQRAQPQAEAPGVATVEGLRVAPMSDALRRQHSIAANVNGLVILGAERGSGASRLPFEPGMVILRADNRVVTSVADLRAAVDRVRSSGRSGVLLLVRTRSGNAPVVLPLAEEAAD